MIDSLDPLTDTAKKLVFDTINTLLDVTVGNVEVKDLFFAAGHALYVDSRDKNIPLGNDELLWISGAASALHYFYNLESKNEMIKLGPFEQALVSWKMEEEA